MSHSLFYLSDHTTGNLHPAVARRLGHKIIGVQVNDDCSSNDFLQLKSIGEYRHPCAALIGK